MSNASKYDTDFYAWTAEQATLLREGRLAEADIANIAEELDSMGRSEKRELVSRLTVLLTHLLKWEFQPGYRGTSWRLTIREQRARLANHLRDNPSLRPSIPEAILTAYRLAVIVAERETGVADTAFPLTCPWSPDQLLSDAFFPDT